MKKFTSRYLDNYLTIKTNKRSTNERSTNKRSIVKKIHKSNKCSNCEKIHKSNKRSDCEKIRESVCKIHHMTISPHDENNSILCEKLHKSLELRAHARSTFENNLFKLCYNSSGFQTNTYFSLK